ncbi:MAG TPA: ABC transporter permease [Streptosporangiaceae bacterium]|jgi:ABC-2 type transport system permease protein
MTQELRATPVRDTYLVFRRYVRQTVRQKPAIVIGMVQPVLYLVLFGPLIGPALGGGSGNGAWRVFVPGVLVQLGLFGAGFAGFKILPEQRWGVVERMRVAPLSRTALLAGRVAHDAAVLVVQSALLLLTGVVMGLRMPVAAAALCLLLVALLGVGLAALSYALGLLLPNEYQFAPVVQMAALPLMLLSGILLPMSLAPGWLDAVSRAVPFRYIVDAMRAAALGDYTGMTTVTGLLVAVVLAVVAFAIGTGTFRRRSA